MNEPDQVFAKCALRLIPFMGLLYFVNFLDRLNVGFAALTMNKDLGFSPAIYGFGAGVFFIGYLLFQVPANVILARMGARRWIFCILAVWGAVSAATAFVRGPAEFYAIRFLLGVAEAGFFPGMMFYLTLWFPPAYRARFGAWFICAIPLSGIIGGPLSGFILGLDGAFGLRGWQWLFLLEGIPSSLLAFAVLKLLPDGPANAAWLSETEKNTIAMRLADKISTQDRSLWQVLFDPRTFALALAGLAHGAALYGTTLWLPQMVQALGFSTLMTGFVTALPYLASMGTTIAWGYSSDRNAERIWHIALPWLLAATGLFIASLAQQEVIILLGLTFATIGVVGAISPYFILPSSFLRGTAAAAAIGLLNTFVSLGAFVGPTLIGVVREETGSYAAAMAMLAAGLVLSALIVLGLRRAMAARADCRVR